MKMYPIAPGANAYQSKENILALDQLVKSRWSNISKALKALRINNKKGR